MSKSAPKVLISDKLSPAAVEIFQKAGIEVDNKPGLTPDELKAIIGNYDGLAIRSATKVTPEVLEKATKLKVIGRAGIGVDNVDVPAATARGIIVMNTPFGNSITTAEHTISLMMSLARNIPAANASTHAGKWEKNSFMGVELSGKTLGLIGCGNIGSIVANRATGLKMKVIAYDPFLSDEKAKEMHLRKVELNELLAAADFITLHTPLNDSTRNILNKDTLAKTKKGVRIVNCARGGLINEQDLKAAIESGHVSGAALDVFEEEPAKSNLLFGMEQVVCTPHLGASTTEAQENVAFQVAEQMADYLNNGTVTNALNMPSISAEDAAKLKPYLELAQYLGSFAGQITETGVKSVAIEYEGHAATLNTKPLTAAALCGFLTLLINSVNPVSAPIIARERGIRVSESAHDGKADYQTLVRITVETDKRKRSICGTLFNDHPRIVEVHGVKLEAAVGPYMLYISNEDKPGFIGKLGKFLGDAEINVAHFHLGRSNKAEHKGMATALIELDHKLDDKQLKAVQDLPGVQAAKFLKF
jgi:D-3-phosphoglycerate dehydrogenase